MKNFTFYCKRIFILISRLLRKSFSYTEGNSTEFWKGRAQCKGQTSVLWTNEGYNTLVRKKEREVLQPYLNSSRSLNVLDIGCGVGYGANLMLSINEKLKIDAVDFKEMINKAKKKHPHPNIRYIISSAEDYLDIRKKYDVSVSLGCFAAIRHLPTMKKAVLNTIKMTQTGGTIIMIDPFHSWNFLARCKFSSTQMIKYMKEQGCSLEYKSGMLFWPYREIYCCSTFNNLEELEVHFNKGEKLLSTLGSDVWSDYKILVFKKD